MHPLNKSAEIEQLQKAILMKRLQKRLQAQVVDAAATAIPRADRSQDLPLSSAQQRLWFVDKLHASAGAAYHMPAGLRLSGCLDKQALQRALDRIVARHEILRTRFIEQDGKPAQVIDEAVDAFTLAETDLRDVAPELQTTAVAQLAEAEAACSFDLARGPLLRGQLITLAENEHVLLLTQHHIVSDGWSVGVLIRELSQLYSAFHLGYADPLPALPLQYADYAVWQRGQSQAETAQADIAFWQKQLAGAPELLAMPTDHPRPAQQSYRGDAVDLELPTSLSAQLKSLSQCNGSTLFMTLLTGWTALLGRFSGQDEVVVGTPVANRERAELEPLIGFFVNTVALRVSMEDDPTVSELMTRVRQTTLAAYDHQTLPFDAIVDAVRPARSLAHAPVFQAMLSLDNTPGTGELELPGLRIRPLEQRYAAAQFDLTLSLTDRGEGITGTLRYASDLFDRASMQRLLQHFEVLLSAMVSLPDVRVSQLPLLDEAQQRELLQRFNAPTRAFDDQGFVHRRFEAQAAARPEAVALTFEGQSLSYGELNRRANRVAHHLLERGVQPDDRVALCVERSLELVVGALAILKAGAGYVPLDPRYPADRLRFALEDSAPVALLTHANLRSQLPATERPVVLINDIWRDDAISAAAEQNPELPQLAPQHLAYVIYTSGSTGKPKGVMVEHRNVARLMTATDDWFGFDDRDVWTLFHSFAFDFSVWELWGALAYGGRLVVVPYEVSRSPQEFHALLCREGVTVLNQTPSAFRQLIAAQGESRTPHHLRYVVFGGEALDPTMLRSWYARVGNRATRLINMYGITETTVHVTYREISLSDAECPGRSPIGVPIPDLQLYVLDRHRQPVPLGMAGELYVGGAGVARGYLNRPELSAERFVTDPFDERPGSRLYRTGDLARRLADGSIDYIGRIDFQVKIRGFRIELGEIEARLASHPGVRDAIVVAREDSPGDKRLVAYVTSADPLHAAPSAEAMRAHLLLQLPDYMAPAAYVVLDALPLTGNGKLDRKALPSPDTQAFARSVYRAPVSANEQMLCRIWGDVLGLAQVGVDDNYFDIGGDSIRSIAVVAQAKAAGLDLAVVDLFKSPTVAGLAATLAARDGGQARQAAIALLGDEDKSRLPSDIEDAYPVTLLQQGMIFHNAIEQDSGLYHDVSSNCLELPEWRPQVMQDVLNALAAKHPVLRTAFDLRRYSEPLQLVHAQARLPMTLIDVAGLDLVAQNRVIAEFIDQERRTAFDLASPPLLRVFIHVRGPRTIQFTLSFHHAILDGWSVASLQTELSGAYASRLQTADAAPLNALALGPKCAVEAERNALRSVDQREFWRGYLNDHAYCVLPPADGEVDAGMHRGRSLGIDGEHSQRLQKLASELGVPLRSVLLAAHLRVMALFANGDDVTTGLVCNVRPEQADGDKVLGLFLNTLPLRHKLSGGSWSELIAATYRNELEVMAHRHYPYFQLQLDNERRPLFDVIFNFTNFHVYDHLALSATDDGASMAFESTGYGLDVNFDFHPQRGILLELTPGNLSAMQTERLLGYYEATLQAIANDPHADHRRVDLLGAAERARLLGDNNATLQSFGAFQPAHRLIEARALAQPLATALVSGDETLSYAELNARANRLAGLLRQRFDLKRDDRIALCLERGSAMVVAMLAVLKAGAAYVPVDPQYPEQRLRYLLDDAAPVAVVSQRSLATRVAGAVPVLLIDAVETEMALNAFDDRNQGPEESAIGPEQLAYVIYTSGSTGQPKGVLVEHRNLFNLVHAHAAMTELSAADRVLQFASFSFDVAVGDVFATLVSGACLVLRPDSVLTADAAFVELMAGQRITVADLPTAFWQQWTTSKNADHALPDLRLLLVGGEKAEADTLQRWCSLPSRRDCRWINAYGPTETTVTATAQSYFGDSRLPTATVPIGRPLANTRIYVLDSALQPVPTGAIGEIYIGGAGVARGYLGREKLTAERFLPDPFVATGTRMYRSGDLGRWLADGSLEFVERNDQQIKLRGFRIELGEIESQLRGCAGVAEAKVVLREDQPGDRRLVAYFTSHERIAPTASELRAQLGQTLADYMLPSAFMALPALPLSPSGKVDLKALPAADSAALAMRPYQAPEGEIEQALAGIWQTLLGVDKIGRDDQFFELGGHSLMVVRLIEQVRHAGHALDVTQVFAAPTLRAMAAAIRASKGRAGALVVPANLIPVHSQRLSPEMLPLVELSQPTLDALVASIPGGAANIQDLYPLGPAQQGILFHHLLQPASDAYLLRTALAFDSRERLNGFVDALRQIVRRHDILRTTVRWQSLEQAVQVVLRDVEFAIETHELVAGTDAQAAFLELTDPRHLRMSLDSAPLLRLHLACNPDNGEWLLALIHHHMVCDHVTIEIMMAELQGYLHGADAQLPAALPYRNFIAQSLATPAGEHEAYFRRVLADVREPTAPFGVLDVQGDGSDVEEVYLDLGAELAKSLRASARRLGVTPAVLFHVAAACVVAQSSGRNDVVLGTVTSGRLQGSEGAASQVLGMFINTLPLRVATAGRSVVDAVAETHAALSELLAHEQASLAMAQRCSGVAPSMPLFTTLFNYRHSQDANSAEQASQQPDPWAGVRILANDERTNYPITISIDDFGDGFGIASQCIRAIDARRVADFMLAALTGLADALQEPSPVSLDRLSILPTAERELVLRSFNDTHRDYPRDVLLHQLFEQQVERSPTATALVCGESTLTYAELNSRVNRLARHLIAIGAGPEQRIAVCVERSVEMVVALYAVLKAGAAYVPLDPSYPVDRLWYMLDDCKPATVLTHAATDELVATLGASCPRIVLDDPSAPWLAQSEVNPGYDGQSARQLAYVIYTSGSTGQPKGAMNEHRGVVNRLLWMQDAYRLDASDRVLQKTPFSFDVSVWEFFWPLITGAALVMARPDGHKDPVYLSELIAAEAITTVHFVPSMLQMFLEHGDTVRCQQLRRVICSGEALPAAAVARFHALFAVTELHNLYGPTEAAVDVTAWHCQPQDVALVPIGRPIANTSVYILDAQQRPVPRGVPGELYLGGVQIGRGYFNRPQLTAERFLPDPFAAGSEARMYRTGDLGRHLPDGAIEYLGRNDFQVKVRGFRIELGEIEAALMQHAALHEAVVIAREDKAGGKQLVAYFTTRSDAAPPDVETLRAHLLQTLPDYMVPSAYMALAELPLSSNGKLDRGALPTADGSALSLTQYAPPRDESERLLCQLWADVLGIERVGIHDNFFDIGGDSIRSISIVGKGKSLGLDFAIVDLFKHPTVAELAHHLRAAVGGAAQVIARYELNADDRAKLPVGVEDAYPISLLQQGMVFHNEYAQGSGVYHDVFSSHVAVLAWRPELLQAALSAISRRHPVLRTAFDLRNYSEPLQLVYSDAQIPIEVFDVSALPTDEQNRTIAEFVHHERTTRFELDQAPLLRVFVHQRDPSGIQFTLSFHHAILDGWSVAALQTELFHNYASLLGDDATALSSDSLHLTPRTVVEQERHALASADERAFWAGYLADHQYCALPPADVDANLQADRSSSLHIPETLSRSLQDLATKLGVPLRSVLLAAHMRAIALLSGKTDVVSGLVCNVRPEQTDGEKVLGLFLNTLPLRVKLQPSSWMELIRATYESELQVLGHRNYPYFQLHLDNGRAPYFEIVFNYTNFHVYDGLDSDPDEPQFRAAFESTGYGLGVNFSYDPSSGLVLEINPASLSAAQADRIRDCYSTILTAMAEQPEAAHHAQHFLPEPELQQLLSQFNPATGPMPSRQLIHQLFEDQVALRPNSVALEFGEQAVAYSELNRNANQLAHRLNELGVRPDDRVAIAFDRGVDMIVAVLAILKAGAAYVPLDPNYPSERLAYMLGDCDPVAVLTQQSIVETLPATSARRIVLDAADTRILLAGFPVHDPDPRLLELRPKHLAYVIYTSGSTGQPKGVMNHHAGLCNLAVAQIDEFAVDADSRVLQFVSISFDVCISEITMALCSGASLQLAAATELLPGAPLLDTLRQRRISHVSLPMAVLAALPDDAELPDLRTLIVGGDVLPPALAERWSARSTLFNSYGPTETTVCASNFRYRSEPVANVPIGRPIANARIYLLDAFGQPAPRGVPGEIHIGGIGVARGYLNEGRQGFVRN